MKTMIFMFAIWAIIIAGSLYADKVKRDYFNKIAADCIAKNGILAKTKEQLLGETDSCFIITNTNQ